MFDVKKLLDEVEAEVDEEAIKAAKAKLKAKQSQIKAGPPCGYPR